MTASLVLYTNPMSRGRTVRWMLEEIGQPYEVELLRYEDGSLKSPGYLAINPMGKVPALRHGDTVVTESAAICAYLADAFPQAGLAPEHGSAARGAYYRWLFFAAGPLEQAALAKAMKFEVSPQQEAMVGYGSLARVLDTLDGALQRTEYLAGDRFSAADVFTGAQLSWLMHFGLIEKRPAFEAYETRLMTRPAAVRAKHTDDMLLAQQTSPQ